MKRNLVLFIGLVLFSFGCASKTKKDVVNSVINTALTINPVKPSTFQKDQLIGIWISPQSDNPTLEIGKDSIYYINHDKSYKYVVKEDSIKIYYEDFIYSAKTYFYKDTLVMNSPEDGIAKFSKVKN